MRCLTWTLSIFALRSRKNSSWVIFLTSPTPPRAIRLMNSTFWRPWSASLELITWLISRWRNKGQMQSLFGTSMMITSQYKFILNGKKSWRRFKQLYKYRFDTSFCFTIGPLKRPRLPSWIYLTLMAFPAHVWNTEVGSTYYIRHSNFLNRAWMIYFKITCKGSWSTWILP